VRIAFAFTLVISTATTASVDCNAAVSRYNSALSDIDSYVRRYSRCVADSRGTDDCSSEFRRLRSAQSDFEDAVSDYQRECRR
jgi:hypothetical protein